MLKRIFLYIALFVIVAYLVLATTYLNAKPEKQICRNIDLLISDSVYSGFIDKKEVSSILKKKKIDPIGKNKIDVSIKLLEEELNKHALIDNVECYWTPENHISIRASQRIPLLRVMCNNNGNYYIDNKGAIMPSDIKCVAHRTIVSGYVEKSFATTDLYNFGVFLQNDPFWNAQIEQINVLPRHNVELIPRVGDHIIYMGSLKNYESKLERLKIFYQKALGQIGWDKYSRINIEFDNQIICTKRHE